MVWASACQSLQQLQRGCMFFSEKFGDGKKEVKGSSWEWTAWVAFKTFWRSFWAEVEFCCFLGLSGIEVLESFELWRRKSWGYRRYSCSRWRSLVCRARGKKNIRFVSCGAGAANQEQGLKKEMWDLVLEFGQCIADHDAPCCSTGRSWKKKSSHSGSTKQQLEELVAGTSSC